MAEPYGDGEPRRPGGQHVVPRVPDHQRAGGSCIGVDCRVDPGLVFLYPVVVLRNITSLQPGKQHLTRGCFAPPLWGVSGILRVFAPPIFRDPGGGNSSFCPPIFRDPGGEIKVFPPHMGGKSPPQAENFEDFDP